MTRDLCIPIRHFKTYQYVTFNKNQENYFDPTLPKFKDSIKGIFYYDGVIWIFSEKEITFVPRENVQFMLPDFENTFGLLGVLRNLSVQSILKIEGGLGTLGTLTGDRTQLSPPNTLNTPSTHGMSDLPDTLKTLNGFGPLEPLNNLQMRGGVSVPSTPKKPKAKKKTE